MNTNIKYFSLFLVTTILITVITIYAIDEEKQMQLDSDKKLVELSYHTTKDSFKNNSDFIFENIINTTSTLDLLKDVNKVSDEEKNIIRNKLFEKYSKLYNDIEKYRLKQLHFHLKNNESFLRFHRPKKFGDNLTDIRQTISYVNKHKTSISGFEEGRIFNGYRFVYPLVYQEEHIGSVELSISMGKILEKIKEDLIGSNADFIIKKSVVDSKVFDSEQSNYIKTSFSKNYYNEKSIKNAQNGSFIGNLLSNYKDKVELEAILEKGNIFSTFTYKDTHEYSTTFLPVINAISKDTVGYIIIAKEYHNHHLAYIYFVTGMFLLINLLFIFFTFKLDKNKQYLSLTNDLLNEAQRVGKIGYWNYNHKNKYMSWSDELYKILEVEKRSFTSLPETLSDFIIPEEKNIHNKEFLTKNNEQVKEYKIKTKSGAIKYLEEYYYHQFDNLGNKTRTIGTVHDITSKKNAYKRLEKFIDLQDNIILITNGVEIEYANQKFFDFIDIKNLAEFKKSNQSIHKLFNVKKKHIKEENKLFWLEKLESMSDKKRIVTLIAKDKIPHTFSLKINSFEKDLMIISLIDINEIILEKQELEEENIKDALTNCYNRKFFEMNYQRIMNQCNKENKYLALAMLDIDFFKKVNDTYGHDVGDVVLQEFVSVIKKYSRDEDILIRWGGEEFLLLLKLSSKDDLVKKLETIRKKIEEYSFSNTGHITCSIGGAIYEKELSIKKTIKLADENLYLAKNQGRNKVII